MTFAGIAVLLLIIANVIVSYMGLKNQTFFDGYKFQVEKILVHKDYKRLVTSGFLHVSWQHLIFNMLTLVFFSGALEAYLGSIKFLIIYFVSLIGGDLLSLFIHRHHNDYDSVGASGAVCGVIFASIALFPGMSVNLFWILPLPGWLYGIIYVGFSIYGIRSKKDNIGHEAHLGGALIGMAIALLMEPQAITANYITILLIAVPAIIFIYLIVTRPHILLVDNFYFKRHNDDFYSIDHKYNTERKIKQQEIDAILDKINKRGMKSLSSEERKKLKEYSESLR